MIILSQLFAAIISTAVLLAGLTGGPLVAHAQTSQPLVIVVRDGAGNPLVGIALEVLLAGPPHEPYDTCVTGETGRCTLVIPPGAYVVHFTRGWRGREFIPTGEQNGGVLDDGGAGGFGVYLEPSDAEQVVTFVVGQDRQSGQLVPLWDLSRDPDAPPEPFVYTGGPLANPDDALSGLDLGALDTTITGSIPQEALDATATAQVVVSAVGGGPEASAEAVAEIAPPTGVPDRSESEPVPGDVLTLGLVGLAALAVVISGLAFLWRRWAGRQEEAEG